MLREAIEDFLRFIEDDEDIMALVTNNAWCPECTLGTTPYNKIKGPCPYHRLKAELKRP